jgi:hypothetical protein
VSTEGIERTEGTHRFVSQNAIPVVGRKACKYRLTCSLNVAVSSRCFFMKATIVGSLGTEKGTRLVSNKSRRPSPQNVLYEPVHRVTERSLRCA